MGISGLLPFVDGAAEEIHISRFSGKRCAIDGYAWLHRGSKTCALQMAKGMPTTGFVDYCVKQFLKMRSFGVEPVLVLDGAALPAKAGTEESRRASRRRHMLEADSLLQAGERTRAMDSFAKAVDVTPEHAYQLILACRKHRVLTYVAPYEADAQVRGAAAFPVQPAPCSQPRCRAARARQPGPLAPERPLRPPRSSPFWRGPGWSSSCSPRTRICSPSAAPQCFSRWTRRATAGCCGARGCLSWRTRRRAATARPPPAFSRRGRGGTRASFWRCASLQGAPELSAEHETES
jgi:hypothetical protein